MDNLISACIGCGICLEKCPLLRELGMPSEFSGDIDAPSAFGCTLCGRCEAVCPSGLSPMRFFAGLRRKAVMSGDIDINEYRYLFPHRPNNMNNVLRKHAGIHYSDLRSHSSVAFLPGCSLLNYSPSIVRAAHSLLKKYYGHCALLDICCGKPADMLGLKDAELQLEKIASGIASAGIEMVVTACPNCFYYMEKVLKEKNVQTKSIYTWLLDMEMPQKKEGVITVHDACPDRFSGKLAASVRALLIKKGYTITETEDNRRTSLCCGAGGMLPYFRNDYSRKWIEMCAAQQKATGAGQAVTYCLSCVFRLDSGNLLEKRPVHVLELIMDIDNDCYAAKDRFKALMSEEKSDEIWKEILDDE